MYSLKRNHIYVICAVSSLILLIVGCCLHAHSVISNVLIGLGCSGVTASLITFFIELRNNSILSHSRSLYFKRLYDSLIMTLQRILWFDERLQDNAFKWDLSPKEYSSLNYMLFSHRNYPTVKLNWDELKDRVKQCEEKYKLESLRTYSEGQQAKITKMFAIIYACSSDLNSHVLHIRMNDVILASQDYMSLDDIDSICRSISMAIELMNKPQKNYGLATRMLMQDVEELRKKCNYNDSEFSIALQGTIHPSEL